MNENELQEIHVDSLHGHWVLIPMFGETGKMEGWISIQIPYAASDNPLPYKDRLLLNYWAEVKRLRAALARIGNYDLDGQDPLADSALRQWANESLVVEVLR